MFSEKSKSVAGIRGSLFSMTMAKLDIDRNITVLLVLFLLVINAVDSGNAKKKKKLSEKGVEIPKDVIDEFKQHYGIKPNWSLQLEVMNFDDNTIHFPDLATTKAYQESSSSSTTTTSSSSSSSSFDFTDRNEGVTVSLEGMEPVSVFSRNAKCYSNGVEFACGKANPSTISIFNKRITRSGSRDDDIGLEGGSSTSSLLQMYKDGRGNIESITLEFLGNSSVIVKNKNKNHYRRRGLGGVSVAHTAITTATATSMQLLAIPGFENEGVFAYVPKDALTNFDEDSKQSPHKEQDFQMRTKEIPTTVRNEHESNNRVLVDKRNRATLSSPLRGKLDRLSKKILNTRDVIATEATTTDVLSRPANPTLLEDSEGRESPRSGRVSAASGDETIGQRRYLTASRGRGRRNIKVEENECDSFREIEVAIAVESSFCAAVGPENALMVVQRIINDVSAEYEISGLCWKVSMVHYEQVSENCFQSFDFFEGPSPTSFLPKFLSHCHFLTLPSIAILIMTHTNQVLT